MAMQKFTKINAVAAVLDRDNVDTDQIYPKQFLRTIQRKGLGQYAFYDMRFEADGSAKTDFFLDQPPYNKAQILITGKNFGSGSSREHAVWSLMDIGIRAIISSDYGDIFYNNAFKSGMLPIVLPPEQVDALMQEERENPGAPIEIDLEKQTITRGNKFSFHFEIDEFRKQSLLNGTDDIDRTLEKQNFINAFEEKRKREKPWL